MNETDAKCIVCSVWEAQELLGTDYTVNLKMTTREQLGSYDVVIHIEKGYEVVFTHSWQTGDTLESFLDGFNARFNSVFEFDEDEND